MSRNPNDPGAYYSLDIAFASAASPTPGNSNKPIAVAFGYSDNSSGPGYTGRGQTKEVLDEGDWAMFAIFDMSKNSNVTLSNFQVRVTNKLGKLSPIVTPFSSSPPTNTPDGKTPVAWPSQSVTSYTAAGTLTPTPGPPVPSSVGCNVQGYLWVYGPFYVANPGKFGITVSFTATGGAGGSPLTYSVDPEMEVQSGGG